MAFRVLLNLPQAKLSLPPGVPLFRPFITGMYVWLMSCPSGLALREQLSSVLCCSSGCDKMGEAVALPLMLHLRRVSRA